MAKIIEFNAETGEEIEREMTSAELKQYNADLSNMDKSIASKEALLQRLGLTQDEIRLLIS